MLDYMRFKCEAPECPAEIHIPARPSGHPFIRNSAGAVIGKRFIDPRREAERRGWSLGTKMLCKAHAPAPAADPKTPPFRPPVAPPRAGARH
jgi:hypothetical protein